MEEIFTSSLRQTRTTGVDIKNLNTYYVKNSAGTLVPLSAVISYKIIENAALFSHFNLFRTAEINGDAKAGFSSGQALQL